MFFIVGTPLSNVLAMQNGMLIKVPEMLLKGPIESIPAYPVSYGFIRTRTEAIRRSPTVSRIFNAAVTGVWLKAQTGCGLKVTRWIDQSDPRREAMALRSTSARAKARTNPAFPSK